LAPAVCQVERRSLAGQQGTASDSATINRPAVCGALLLCLAVNFTGVINHGVWGTDESRVAAISLAMAQSGDFVVPQLAGEAFVEKPPLSYAGSAALIWLFGPALGDAQAARLFPALCGLITMLMMFLLARRLFDQGVAMVAVMLLATTASFVGETHTLRVDAALMMCVSGAVWALAEAYLESRRGFLVIAGIFTGCAILAKGLVALSFIGISWIALFVPWLWTPARLEHGGSPRIGWLEHVCALAALVATVGAWVIPFRIHAGTDLWHEWLWRNQLGRLSGPANLGHTSDSGDVLYYGKSILADTLPWTPLLLVWAWRQCCALRRRRSLDRGTLDRGTLLLVAWGVGSAVLLSLSATRRGVYLMPAIPPLAILCAHALVNGFPAWTRKLYLGLMIACAVALVAVLLLPVAASLFELPTASVVTGGLYLHWTPLLLVPLFALPLVWCCIRGISGLDFWPRVVAVVAVCFVTYQTVTVAALDRYRGVEAEVQTFVQTVLIEAPARVASFNLSEGARGSISFHAHHVFEPVDDARAVAILAGRDPQFDSLVLGDLDDLDDLDGLAEVRSRVEAELYLGSRNKDRKDRYRVFWVRGLRGAMRVADNGSG